MDARRWQSPAAAAAAAEAAAEDASGRGAGPSRRPPRRGLHRASPYGLSPRPWLPKPPVASSAFSAASRDHAAAGDNRMGQYESMDVAHASRVTHELSRVHFNYDGSGLAEIEKIIKQKQFSRDETERLIEIMRSRTPDLHDDDQIAAQSFAKQTEITPFSNKLVIPAKPDERNWGTDMFAQSNVHDVTSPIELARAYMEAQTSASVLESQKRKFIALSHGVEIENSASKLARFSCRDHTNNYLTPQSNKRRALPSVSSRLPYTGSVFRRSVKRTGHFGTYSNSSGRPQLSTPFSVGSKAMIEDKMPSTDGVFGVQPSTSSERVHADAVGTDTPLTVSLERPHGKGTIESGSTTGRIPVADNISKCAAVSVHPKSSQTAWKILQHLERTIPSPTVKPELRRPPKKLFPCCHQQPV
ncbi:hypothetical protein ZWY2020_002335 [Hordeum vulgare]|nr:hypothetical protein ZWY2020_002335 [Hordeum vulgare]